ncbi:ABC transporter substrate-binding protein [Cohnella silvisoli]|uniref:ABC transporter substrate-binding protein n=1 Tax=Cohnella silvisoli TaxID=2873699 RepID=A0ABV1KYJ5_9BACL|nr:ABC transporter substrate-binding protein [Cohnella silvisoli]MCD9024445.1 ABC transporter substrate-binding protein [Cohnella silvisoli]
MFRNAVRIGLLTLAVLFVANVGLTPSTDAAEASRLIKVVVDGKSISLSTALQLVKGRLLVPYSEVVAGLGGKVSWDQKTKTVKAVKGNITVAYTAGSSTAYINNEKRTLESAPVSLNNTTFVPLRFLAQSFGMWVRWDGNKKQVTISSTLTVQTKVGPLTLNKVPQRIVTLSSSDTEIVAALGGHIVGRATALGKVYPPEAASIPEVGSTHGINFETLAALKPDLVIGSPSLQPQAATIEKLGARMLLNSHNVFEEIKNSIRLYGEVLGKEEEAEKLIKGMDGRLKKVMQSPPLNKPKTLILYGAPGSFVVALPSSYPGNFLLLAGGNNVAADFPKMDTMPQYAEFSMERIVAADPDVIYLITHGDPVEVKASFKKELESNPAWKNLGAVKTSQFEVLPNDLFAANPGLRAPDAITYLNELLLQVKISK